MFIFQCLCACVLANVLHLICWDVFVCFLVFSVRFHISDVLAMGVWGGGGGGGGGFLNQWFYLYLQQWKNCSENTLRNGITSLTTMFVGELTRVRSWRGCVISLCNCGLQLITTDWPSCDKEKTIVHAYVCYLWALVCVCVCVCYGSSLHSKRTLLIPVWCWGAGSRVHTVTRWLR